MARLDQIDWRTLEFQGYRSGRERLEWSWLKTARISTTIIDGKEEAIKTLEFSVTTQYFHDHLASLGDSGSLLFPLGETTVVGMIVAGAQINDIAFFTRIDDLRDDILEQTGGTGIRMYDL